MNDNSHHCYDCNLNFELSTMLLMHNLDIHRKAGITRRKISSLLSNLLENETLYSSDSECEYRITTTVRRIAKIKPELRALQGSDDDSKSSNRITRSGSIAIKRETSELDGGDVNVDRQISCLICGFTAGTEHILKEHIENGHDTANENCEISFPSEFRRGEGDNPSIEMDCSIESEQSTERIRSKKFSCDKCGKQFKQKAALAKHMKIHCQIDDEDEDDQNGIADGASDNYDTDDNDVINSKPKSTSGFRCDVCDKVFYRPKCFATHLKKHNEANVVEKRRTKNPKKKTHLCSFCGKSYPGSNHLKIHLRIHTGERPFKCQYCDKTFAIKKTWQDHTYSHTGEKPYSCPVENCGKRFTHSTGVRQHMQCCHSSEKQFQCPHCEKKCSKKTHLEDHIRSHTGERPYECKYCGIRFRLTSTLRIHHRTHTGERPFVCSVCNRGFIKSYGLKQHLKNKRNCLPASVQPTLPPEIQQQQQQSEQLSIEDSASDDVQFHQLLILPTHQVLS